MRPRPVRLPRPVHGSAYHLAVWRGVAWWLVGLALLPCRPARAEEGFTFSVEPARAELVIPPGKRRGKTLTINNTKSDQPTHLVTYVTDLIYLPDGTHDFPPAGSTEWSCAKWVQVSPTELDVPAGKTAEVRISASVPEGAQGGYYAMVFFETVPSYAESGIGVNFRIGALVDVTIPNTAVAQAKLANLAVAPPQSILLEIFNEGNILIRPKGRLKLFDTAGQKILQEEFNPDRLGILPRTLRRFTHKLKTPLTRGSYRLRAEIDYGARQILLGELPLVVQ